MQKPLRSAIRITCFLVVLALVLVSVCHVLKPKNDDGIYDMELFYELPEDSVEVLVLGSSHAYCGFNTGVLWREQGMGKSILKLLAKTVLPLLLYLAFIVLIMYFSKND